MLLAQMLFSLFDWGVLVHWRDEVRHRVMSTPDGACWSCPAMVYAYTRSMTKANEDPRSVLMTSRLSAARFVRSFWEEWKLAEVEKCVDHGEADDDVAVLEQDHPLFM